MKSGTSAFQAVHREAGAVYHSQRKLRDFHHEVSKLGIVIVLIILVYWYWLAAKLFGWRTAWIDRAVALDQQRAQNDARAAVASTSKWVTVAVVLLTLPIIVLSFLGLGIAASIAWRW
jgi:hypothetical protein